MNEQLQNDAIDPELLNKLGDEYEKFPANLTSDYAIDPELLNILGDEYQKFLASIDNFADHDAPTANKSDFPCPYGYDLPFVSFNQSFSQDITSNGTRYDTLPQQKSVAFQANTGQQQGIPRVFSPTITVPPINLNPVPDIQYPSLRTTNPSLTSAKTSNIPILPNPGITKGRKSNISKKGLAKATKQSSRSEESIEKNGDLQKIRNKKKKEKTDCFDKLLKMSFLCPECPLVKEMEDSKQRVNKLELLLEQEKIKHKERIYQKK